MTSKKIEPSIFLALHFVTSSSDGYFKQMKNMDVTDFNKKCNANNLVLVQLYFLLGHIIDCLRDLFLSFLVILAIPFIYFRHSLDILYCAVIPHMQGNSLSWIYPYTT